MARKKEKSRLVSKKDYQEKYEGRTAKKPKSITEVEVGKEVFLFAAGLATEKDRMGKVVGHDLVNQRLIMKFPREELHSDLRFYGKSWALLKK